MHAGQEREAAKIRSSSSMIGSRLADGLRQSPKVHAAEELVERIIVLLVAHEVAGAERNGVADFGSARLLLSGGKAGVRLRYSGRVRRTRTGRSRFRRNRPCAAGCPREGRRRTGWRGAVGRSRDSAFEGSMHRGRRRRRACDNGRMPLGFPRLEWWGGCPVRAQALNEARFSECPPGFGAERQLPGWRFGGRLRFLHFRESFYVKLT